MIQSFIKIRIQNLPFHLFFFKDPDLEKIRIQCAAIILVTRLGILKMRIRIRPFVENADLDQNPKRVAVFFLSLFSLLQQGAINGL